MFQLSFVRIDLSYKSVLQKLSLTKEIFIARLIFCITVKSNKKAACPEDKLLWGFISIR
jgi:hypothetical protein